MSLPSARLSVRERCWLPLEYIRTVGPLTGVTAARLRAALTGLHAADPTHRAVCRLDRAAARWIRLSGPEFAAYCQDAVTDLGGRPADPDVLTRQLLAEPRGHHPVRILVGGPADATYLALKIAHAYGDAGPVNDLLRELLRAAAGDRPAQFPPDPRPRLPLSGALWRQFGRRPRRLADALRITRPPAGAPLGPDDRVPWQADITVETARSAQALGRMRAWRDAHAPGVSTAAITFAAFTAALAERGLASSRPGAVFLADARRYLPAGGSVGGNFCWGQYLAPVDLLDPAAVHAALKAELASGRMLAMMALREARIAVAGGQGLPAPYPTRVPGHQQPELTFSNQGRHDVLADLPWAAGPDGRVNHSVPTLSAPAGITLTTSELGGTLHLEATFHRTSYSPDTVAAALGQVCADPAALLMAVR